MLPWILLLRVYLWCLEFGIASAVSLALQEQHQQSEIIKTRITTLVVPQDADGPQSQFPVLAVAEAVQATSNSNSQWRSSTGATPEAWRYNSVPLLRGYLIPSITTTVSSTTSPLLPSLHRKALPTNCTPTGRPNNHHQPPSCPRPTTRGPRPSRPPSPADVCWAATECKKAFIIFQWCYGRSGGLNEEEDLKDERLGLVYRKCVCDVEKGAFVDLPTLQTCTSCLTQALLPPQILTRFLRTLTTFCSPTTTPHPNLHPFLLSLLTFLSDANAPETFTEIDDTISRVTTFLGGESTNPPIDESVVKKLLGQGQVGKDKEEGKGRYWPYTKYAVVRSGGRTTTTTLTNTMTSSSPSSSSSSGHSSSSVVFGGDADAGQILSTPSIILLVHSLRWFPRPLPSSSGMRHPLAEWELGLVSTSSDDVSSGDKEYSTKSTDGFDIPVSRPDTHTQSPSNTSTSTIAESSSTTAVTLASVSSSTGMPYGIPSPATSTTATTSRRRGTDWPP